jgi:transposase
LLEPVFNALGKRGPKRTPDLRRVVDGMLCVSHTGCQWQFVPESFREVRRVGWDDKQPVFRPVRHAWRVEVAHGGRRGRSRRLAKSFENTITSATGWLQVAGIDTTLRHLSHAQPPRRALPAAA